MSNRIKKLQTTLPRGRPFDTRDLEALGISPALAHQYVKSGWLEKLGRGVFMFAGDKLDGKATLRFLEKKIPGLHVAAKTALAWHGFRHNLAHRETLALRGRRRTPPPEWFRRRFPCRYSSARLFEEDLPPGFAISRLPDSPDGPAVSEPERALLEMLSEVGVRQEIEEARQIMETLRRLRARHLAKLLESCRMVKAVRLCVSWAEELDLPWAGQARAAAGKTGDSRWVARLRNGRTLVLKP